MSEDRELNAYSYPVLRDQIVKFPDNISPEDLIYAKFAIIVSKDKTPDVVMPSVICYYGVRSDVEELIKRRIHDTFKAEEEHRKIT